jgi:putative spermidine/putrescine transport system permease protein
MTDATSGPDNLSGVTPDTGLKIGQSEASGPVLAADGTPLKSSLNRALRRQKIRALLLIAPLLFFIMITFILPIGQMLFRSVENQIVSDTLPRTTQILAEWDGQEVPGVPTFEALARDLAVAVENKNHTRLGSRLNYETTGISSLFRKTGRSVDEVGESMFDALEEADPAWDEPATMVQLMGSDGWNASVAQWITDGEDGMIPVFEPRESIASLLPDTTDLYASYAELVRTDEDNPYDEDVWPIVFHVFAQEIRGDLDLTGLETDQVARLEQAQTVLADLSPTDPETVFLEADEDWGDIEVWTTIQTYSPAFTAGYFLNSVDMQTGVDGPEWRDESQQIYLKLFWRTMVMSLTITISCIALGYPIAWLLANLPASKANLLMILVLLPFWTSLLVRTSAWKVLLQNQGVINELLVWIGIVNDDGRLALINNATGTVIAMTHILLPFMILPLYSVMKTIPPSYLRAAKSLGATNFTAFRRVYFPQSVPGIGAGSILVFILSIGYYITPEIVGGTSGVFISNRIAYHISTSLNWGLAAALGSILLAIVLIFYWMYDRIVGIDNVKLGG